MTEPLDLAALHHFAERGFHVAEALIPPALCDHLLAALSALIARHAAARLHGTRPERPFWDLMPPSAHDVEVFFDPSPGPLSELPAAAWETRAMRIGHALHLVDPTFATFCRSPPIAEPLSRFAHLAALLSTGVPADQAVHAIPRTQRGLPMVAASPSLPTNATSPPSSRARIVQSAVIYKQPHSDAVQFGFHRDSAYLPGTPESLVLAFVALDATTLDNGCLQVIPGTHREPLGLRLRLGPQGFVAHGREPRPPVERALALPVPRGSVIFAHGRTLHASEPNRSDGPRRALIVHAIAAASRLDPDAWVVEPPAGFVPLD